MGNGITHVFALKNFEVVMIDIDPGQIENGLNTISKNLDRMLHKGRIGTDEKIRALLNISTKNTIDQTIEDVDLVVEAISENEEIKLEIFKDLSTFCHPACILASNTSSISITKLASVVDNPERVIGMHFMNPVPVMQLIEVIRGYQTSDKVTHQILEIGKILDKTPVEVNDYPGFISNRILMPMINEAIWSLHEGVATAEAIDQIMKLGMAHPMGPLELADFIGLDVCHSILNVMYQGLGNQKYAPCPLLTNMVLAGDLGRKTGMGFYSYSQNA